MNRTAPPAHWVRHNAVTRVPRNFIYLDSEARRDLRPGGELQTFRLAVASHDRRRHDRDKWVDRETEAFLDTRALWEWVDGRTQARARTVLVAHNLAYDVRITAALSTLPSLGWSLKNCRLDRGQAWFDWRRDGRTLIMCDSMAWCPVSLERLGEWVEIPKLPLPPWDDTDAAWEARCRRDVEILAAVWRRLVEWVKADDLGNWKPTGAGQSWAAFRHRFMGHRILAHDNANARGAERDAAFTGRCEAWQHGRAKGGPFAEWDATAAYAHVGAECSVPIKLVGETSAPTLAQHAVLTRKYAVLAEVTVTTDVPTVPARVGGRIAWPTGTFATTLWENELALALDHGATVAIERVWWYRRAPALRAFNEWVLDRISPEATALDPVIACAAKHWSRALVGRFGARWGSWETVGRAPTPGLSLSTVIDRSEGRTWELLQVGHELKRRTATFDSPDAVVAVMSWIMAECRVRLWGVLEAAGPENVLYMDTDGVIVNATGSQRLRSAAVTGLRLKSEWRAVEVLGPRQIILSGALRASGVPRGAVPVAPGVWQGDVWSELTSSIRSGRAESVSVSQRRIRVSGLDMRRDHLEGGRTAPRRVSVDAVG